MSSVMRPVGPERPATYWRRRVVLLVLLVVLVLLVWQGVRLLGGGDDDAGGATSQGSGTTTGQDDAPAGDPTPTPTATAEDGTPMCHPSTVQVTATADASSYAQGATATFGVEIRHTGTDPCALDVGSAAIELLVVSGSDRIWSSDDCAQDEQSDVLTIPAGAVAQSTVTWDLTRSTPECAGDLPQPRPGTYQLTGRVGEIGSEPVVLTLT